MLLESVGIEAADITGIPFITDVDRGQVEEILNG